MLDWLGGGSLLRTCKAPGELKAVLEEVGSTRPLLMGCKTCHREPRHLPRILNSHDTGKCPEIYSWRGFNKHSKFQ